MHDTAISVPQSALSSPWQCVNKNYCICHILPLLFFLLSQNQRKQPLLPHLIWNRPSIVCRQPLSIRCQRCKQLCNLCVHEPSTVVFDMNNDQFNLIKHYVFLIIKTVRLLARLLAPSHPIAPCFYPDGGWSPPAQGHDCAASPLTRLHFTGDTLMPLFGGRLIKWSFLYRGPVTQAAAADCFSCNGPRVICKPC